MNKKYLQDISVRLGIVTALFIITCMVDAHGRTFKKEPFTYNRKIAVDTEAVTQIADEVSHFFELSRKGNFYTSLDEGKVFKGVITLQDVIDTINFIAQTGKKNPKQFKSHWYWGHYFDCYRWYSDGDSCSLKIGKLPRGWKGAPDAIRVTKYRICKIHGSHEKTKNYSFPLYAPPTDEQGKTRAYVREHPQEFVRFAYTKDQIIQGVFEGDLRTKPIAWVTPQGYQELAMQGGALIDFGDGSHPQMFRVVVANGKEGNDKYWFITQYQKPKPSKKYPIKVDPVPGASFAGNIPDLGFGKVLMMIGKNPLTLEKEMRVGVLVDTGSAFQDNLCKIDFFTGYFEDHHLFDEHCKQYPHTAEFYVLIKKRKKP